jgi:hypothetical protein
MYYLYKKVNGEYGQDYVSVSKRHYVMDLIKSSIDFLVVQGYTIEFPDNDQGCIMTLKNSEFLVEYYLSDKLPAVYEKQE